ncbi:phosphatidate cytidylyltransferase [Iodobacter sp. LRB]|uniref:phosphatidate cytidylyltransferase n=1 Tax=unclassified Iodobacter TaxID=235634 RepID=UPI000C1209B2|nr:phosphatidate cytidylyltransferase [Iodobacter sp. BJB302]PHV03669.1 phosphatidate cytidylyltransferase [Iodobacter sp. BJB302]
MLKTRVLTALFLLPLLLAAIFYLPQMGTTGSLAWISFCGLIMVAASWEWQRLSGMQGFIAKVYPLLTAVVFALLSQLIYTPSMLLGLMLGASVFWLFVTPCWLSKKWKLANAANLNILLGWALLLPAGLALIVLRTAGPWALLAVLAIAWVADSAAYFFGKAFGKHKLAPLISPGKSWEGAAGGLLGVLIYTFFLPKHLFFHGELLSLAAWLAIAVILTAVSVMGDLLESLFKRQIGMKDSSNLLPGHGGVLDRVDSLLAILPVACAIYLSFLLF